jgi:2-dehydro-3-deoxyphosphogluconate aldolase/(4S)-4-hydroxy-2-oxoglutarate aldolase
MTRTIADICGRLVDPGIIAVVRAPSSDVVVPLSRALLAGGVIAIEITMTTPNALEAIRQARTCFGRDALIGVGTVLNAATATEAIEAGAEFVVSPITRVEIIEAAHQKGCPVMLGAYTPTEAQTAHEAGADFIKIFPADTLGAAYIKAIRAPLPHLRIVPTGGVDLQTLGDFLRAGCVAVGVGSSLLSPQLIRDQRWDELSQLAAQYVEAARTAR